jgi:hypothetical protein
VSALIFCWHAFGMPTVDWMYLASRLQQDV